MTSSGGGGVGVGLGVDMGVSSVVGLGSGVATGGSGVYLRTTRVGWVVARQGVAAGGLLVLLASGVRLGSTNTAPGSSLDADPKNMPNASPVMASAGVTLRTTRFHMFTSSHRA